jgi:hypothetical protein
MNVRGLKAMVYFMTDATMAWGPPLLTRRFLDADSDQPFNNLPYADPDEVKLTAGETEDQYTIGHGYRVAADRAPKKALWQARKNAYAITDIASILGQTLVSEKFKDLVESREPGVHQFIPVDIFDKAGGAISSRHYWLNVCRRKDCVDPVRSKFEWIIDYSGVTGFWDDQAHPDSKLTFSKEKIGDMGLWVNPHLLVHRNFYASTGFMEAARAAGMTGMLFAEHPEF